MPNHCVNRLRVSGPQEELMRFVNKAVGYDSKHGKDGEKYDFVCQNFIPRPADQDDNWYAWNVANWGTKWGVYNIERIMRPRSVEYWFDSAWSPPVPVIEFLIKKYPTLRFSLSYWEGGMGFKGWFRGKGGQVTYDKEANYRGYRGG